MSSWEQEKIASFQNDFLTWYEKHLRNLPWRVDTNPYRIWISEIMLQQTRVETVVDYFYRFMEKYPTVESLANAHEDELLKIWEGLGYYSRARNLQIAAKQIVENHGGKMPNTPVEISTLKGIGPYTTGAIASIAFNLPEPAIDGNVMRVTSRLFEIDADISKASSRKVFDKYMRKIISHKQPGEFNQAMMDLGSSVCTPTSPKCKICPIQSYCQSYENQTMLNFPVKTKKIKQKPLYYIAFVLKNKYDEYYLERRDGQGLLANMWTFPMVEVTKEAYEKLEFQQPNLANDFVLATKPLGETTHIFSHLKWHIQVFEGLPRENFIAKEENLKENQAWVSKKDFGRFVFPKPQIKMFDLLKSSSKKVIRDAP